MLSLRQQSCFLESHHLWNSTTQLTYGTAVASGGAVGVCQTFDATAGLQDVIHGHFQPGSQVPEKMKNYVSGNHVSGNHVSGNQASHKYFSGKFF